jgi:lysophospholipase L1-like esterase
MRSVLCYGDSNTWGYDPAARRRFAAGVRWTGVLAKRLGSGYRVIEEGLNGRTTRWDDPIEIDRNGLAYLRPCVESHNPLDLVIVMLGTNDLKRRFDLTASDIAQSAADVAATAHRFARTADDAHAPVLLLAPPAVTQLTEFDEMFSGAQDKSRQFSHYYRIAAGWHGLPFFDAGSVVVPGNEDGVHLDAAQHRVLGEALSIEVQRLLGNR